MRGGRSAPSRVLMGGEIYAALISNKFRGKSEPCRLPHPASVAPVDRADCGKARPLCTSTAVVPQQAVGMWTVVSVDTQLLARQPMLR